MATKSITQNRSRVAALDYITANGGVITDAVTSQDWPGEAAVDVSIINWIKNPSSTPTSFTLDRGLVSGINSHLQAGSLRQAAVKLAANAGRSFEGCKPTGSGFILTELEAKRLLSDEGADYAKVVRLYLNSNDIANDARQRPSRWIIDFGLMPLEEAMNYPAALAIVRERVKPVRDSNRRASIRDRWWRYGEARPALRTAVASLSRFIAVGRHGKRLLFAWSDPSWCPSDATNVIARDDDWTFGVLSSSFHEAWARQLGSTLEDRLRYTPDSVFVTYPFPSPDSPQRDKIEQAARDVVEERSRACTKLLGMGKKQAGLTAVYNAMDEGAFAELRTAHRH